MAATRHDHRRCVSNALGAAALLCRRRGARLTSLRAGVLEIVWRGHAPIGAYAILERLRREHGQAAPPTVYRALDFLLAQGLIHRIESMNAFIGCPRPAEAHGGQFLLCTLCGTAAELADKRVEAALTTATARAGFRVEARVVELRGLCRVCTAAEARHAG